MNKDLIIVESPAKVKTIKKFLGKDYEVDASVGHVRDLPTKTLGVDEEHDFTPQYQVLHGKKKVVDRLKKEAARANRVYLAPDPDREGEAIAWHVAELIKDANSDINRIQFNEITASAVKEALKNSRELDRRLFDSQQARRILDRLVGYKLSPLLWQKVKRGISAGRVQSVALRLIVDRERERMAFVSEEYWVFKADLQGREGPVFEAELWKLDSKKASIGSGEEAEALAKEVEKSSFTVSKVEEKQRQKQPKPPFITSTLQQEASARLKFSAKKTMTLAQNLYEGLDIGHKGTTALITYMRTDSVRISNEAREQAREWIVGHLGSDFYPPKPRFFKQKGSSQDAHEAVRPVDVNLHPDEIRSYLSNDQYRLYKLIWQRFLASQAAAAKYWDTTVQIQAGRTLWRVKGERLIFPGFLKIYTPNETLKEIELPPLQENDALELVKLKKEQKFTQPPARYSEASLVRKLEELGIGRPSTYAQILSTIRSRDYVRMEARLFAPTELGFTVIDLLSAHFQSLMDVKFTAQMEEKLDKVAEGKVDWTDLLKDFARDFYPTLEKAEAEMAQVKTGKESGLICEQCGRPMVIKFGKNGEFLACSGYPECRNSTNFTRDENGAIRVVEKEPQQLEKVGTCPECSSDLVVKKARKGNRFIACSGYPKCKYARSYSTGVPCPKKDCPGELVEKSSKRGKVFYACDQYPECDFAMWAYPVKEQCPKCGGRVLGWKTSQARGEHLACPVKGCGFWKEFQNPG
ncbi:MAG: type I DNA topoisomerase [Desulfohalobiaceae bacterium]|nr:type I DNA topoisomerase [Desulfohalobiaceae bacterium]